MTDKRITVGNDTDYCSAFSFFCFAGGTQWILLEKKHVIISRTAPFGV